MKKKILFKLLGGTFIGCMLFSLSVCKVRAFEMEEGHYNRAIQLTEETIQQMNNGNAILLYDENGYLSFLNGRFYDQPVSDYEEAIEALNGVASLLGITKGCEFFAVYGSTDPRGYTYLSYKQRYGNITIENASLKIVLDPDGYPCLLSCSFAREIGMDEGEDGITAEQAKNQVRTIFWKTKPEILEKYTRKTTILMNGIAYRGWEIYTYNKNQKNQEDRPYNKHIIFYDGSYYKTIQVSSPVEYSKSDPAFSEEGEEFFKQLQSVPYSKMVHLYDGTPKKLNIVLGYDTEDDMYYLADPERKIAVADFAARVYQNEYKMVREKKKEDFEDHSLLTYATYCQVYDYFKQKSMDSIDGFGIPILILTGYCQQDGTPIDNAGFMGIQDGWGLFADSEMNHYGEAVDVIAHEYMHGIREYALGGDLYENKTGAIHEAYSDIIGNICEMEMGATEDLEWTIGENSGKTLRSMSNPNKYGQPVYEGDSFYCEETRYPSAQNDQGGVHINSGILNHIAYQIGQMGLSYEEQYWLWMISNELLTPCSDYDDVCAALYSVSKICGYPDVVGAKIIRIFEDAKVLYKNNDSLWKKGFVMGGMIQ